MGLDQKIENVLGRLEIIVPTLEKYQQKVDGLTTVVAALDERLRLETESLRREISRLLKRMDDMVPSQTEKRNRVWDGILLVISNVVGIIIGMLLSTSGTVHP